MLQRSSLSLGIALLSAASALSLPARSDPPTKAILPQTALRSIPAQKLAVSHDFGSLPLSFESNLGQTDPRVRFLTHNGDGTLFLTPTEAVFSLTRRAPKRAKSALLTAHGAGREAAPLEQMALRMQIVGADPKATVITQEPLAGSINYFVGRDPGKWHTGVPTFGRAGFHGVYPGIDLVYYGNQRYLEYDFVVAPHADPKRIQLHFAGAQGVRVNTAGDLLVRMQGRDLCWQRPTVYQQAGAGKQRVAARFRLKRLPQGQVSVSFALGRYDHSRPMVIDPVLYSTYLGGSNALGDQAMGIAVDSGGNAYITGVAYSTDFPITSGAFQQATKAAANAPTAFVTKLNSTGTALVYSTYLGGSGAYGTGAYGIAIDSSGNAYITGSTSSTDFPTTPGAYQRAIKSNTGSAFVTKLNSTGTALLYSTYLEGSAGADGTAIAIDSGGNAYVVGSTTSTDFPVTPGAFQPVNRGVLILFADVIEPNAFVTKLNPSGSALVYSTYLGGNYGEHPSGIAVDSGGNAYVAGGTESTDFPVTPGAFQLVKHGWQEPGVDRNTSNLFITKLNPVGTALIYSTYLGGSGDLGGDSATGIALDSSGNVFVCGATGSADFPTTPGAFQPVFKGNPEEPGNAFVTKLNPTGSALVYSTFVGGSGYEEGDIATGIALDSNGSAYITGYTDSIDFPTTLGAYQRLKNAKGSTNTFLTRLSPSGDALLYSTYLGGNGRGGQATGIALGRNGTAYVTGYTYSMDFPTTPGAFQRVKQTQNTVTPFVTWLSPIPVLPDFNNDGSTDILLQNPNTGAIASWFMQDAQQLGSASFSLTPPIDYALVGVGDFRGNGELALVLQSRITNVIALWYTGGVNNSTIAAGDYVSVTPPTGWKVVGVGDFNGDGRSDLVLQNQTTRQIAIWFMNGPKWTGGVYLPDTPLAGWSVVGTGDFNKDGFPDIVLQNQTTGQIALRYMKGTTYLSGTILTTLPGAGWKVAGVGDYNGDGSADLLFQNPNGSQAAVWYLQNGAFVGGSLLSPALPSGWKIVGPR